MNRSDAKWIAIAMACAIVYRVAFLLAMPRVIDTADAFHYLEAAQHMAAGAFTEANPRIPPLYPLMTAPWIAMGFDAESAGRGVSFVMGWLALIPIALVARELFDKHTASIMFVMAALWPWLADWSCRIAPESTAMLLWFGGIWCGIRLIRGGMVWIAPTAAAYFLLHLTRPEGMYLMAAAAPGIVLAAAKAVRRQTAMRAGGYIGACVGLLAVQFVIALAFTGEGRVQSRVSGRTAEYIFVERSAELADTFVTVFVHNIPIMIGPYFGFFALIGLLARGEESRRNEVLMLWMAAAQVGLAILSTYSEPRYVMMPVIVLGIWSSRGMAVIAERFREPGKRWIGVAPAAGMCVIMLIGAGRTVGPHWIGSRSLEPVEYKAAGEWMRENVEPGLIVTRKPQVGYYARMESTGPLPDHSVPRMIEWMRAIDAKYLVVDERYTAVMAPNLKPLLNPANAPPALTPLKSDLSDVVGARIVIYELADP